MSQAVRQYSARVVDIHDISADTRKLFVEIDHKQKLDFQAGQYAHLLIDGFDERPFSIASSPHENALEFHIKNGGQGISAHIIQELKPGHQITVKGPFGQSHWRPSTRPLIALAGGLGIVPMKSIIDAALHAKGTNPLYLYWGARFENQLYLHDYFKEMAKNYARFSYIPVISDEPATPYRQGFATNALLEDFDSLNDFAIYLAGPKTMCDAALPLLLQKNAEEDCIFSDSFTV